MYTTHHSLLKRVKDRRDSVAWQEFYDFYRPLVLRLPSIIFVVCASALPAHVALGVDPSGQMPEHLRFSRRVLRFPARRSLGVVQVRPWATTNPLRFKKLADARGDVTIPAGAWAKLVVAKKPSVDLLPLTMLGHDDLQEIDLSKTDVIDGDLVEMRTLFSLRALNLSRTKIGDAGLQHLLKFSELRYLDLTATRITDAGLEFLEDMTVLTTLRLSSTRITDEGLRGLKPLKNLRELRLSDTAIGDDGLRHLWHLPEVEILTLRNTKISDAGLRQLQNLPKLSRLNLRGCKITDQAIEHLQILKRLASLDLRKTKLTPEGLGRLKKALPDCEIKH